MLDPYKIHINQDDSDTSDSGNSEFDEDYFKYKPPPMVILPENVVVIKASTNPPNNDDGKNCNVHVKKKEKNEATDQKEKKLSGNKKTSKKVTELNTKSVKLGISTSDNLREKYSETEKSHKKISQKNEATDQKEKKLSGKKKTSKKVTELNTKSVKLGISTSDNLREKYSETEKSHKKLEEENIFIRILKQYQQTPRKSKKKNKKQDNEKNKNQHNLEESKKQSGKGNNSNMAPQTVSHNAPNITNLQGPTQYNLKEKGDKEGTKYTFYKYRNGKFEIYNGPLIEIVESEDENIQNENDLTGLSIATSSNRKDPSMSGAAKNVDDDTVVDMTQNIQPIMSQSCLTHSIHKEPSHSLYDLEIEQTLLSNHKLLDYTRNSNDLIAKTYSFNNSSFLEEQDQLYVEQVYNQTMLEMPLKKRKRGKKGKKKKNEASSTCDEDEDQTIMLPITNYEDNNIITDKQSYETYSHCSKTSDTSNKHISHELEEVHRLDVIPNTIPKPNYGGDELHPIDTSNATNKSENNKTEVDVAQKSMSQSNLTNFVYKESKPSHNLFYPEFKTLSNHKLPDYTKIPTDRVEMPLKKEKENKEKSLIYDQDLELVSSKDQTTMLPISNDDETNLTKKPSDKTYSDSKTSDILNETLIKPESEDVYHYPTESNVCDSKYNSLIEVGQKETLKNINQKATSSIKYDSKNKNSLECPIESYKYSSHKLSLPEKINLLYVDDNGDALCSKAITDRKPIENSLKNKMKNKITEKFVCNEEDLNVIGLMNQTVIIPKPNYEEDPIQNGCNPIDLSLASMSNSLDQSLPEAAKNVNTDMAQSIQKTLSQSNLTNAIHKKETYSFNNSSFLDKTEQLYVEPTSDQSTIEKPLTKKKKTRSKKKFKKCILDEEQICDSNQITDQKVTNSMCSESGLAVNIGPMELNKNFGLGNLENIPWIPIGNNPAEFCVDSSEDEQFQTISNSESRKCIKENKQEMDRNLTPSPQDEAETVSGDTAHHSVPKKPSILDHCLNSMTNIPNLVVMGSVVLFLMYLFKEK